MLHRVVKLFCYNCDTQAHVLFDCPKPKVLCEECGEKGHLTKHCYVRNDKLLPSGMAYGLWCAVRRYRALRALC
eukprot:6967329-Prymnesium_polylepis.1